MSADATATSDEVFDLFDLRVEVVAPAGAKLWCNNKPGDYFEVRGELLHFRADMPFSMYSLAAVLPLLPAKQRPCAPADWMNSDADVACPDPNCPSRLRITRMARRVFSHGEATATPLPASGATAGNAA